MAQIKSFKELVVYQKAYYLAIEIFNLTKQFPKEEKYSLIDQIRRSSRSITTNIAEAWAKRIYEKSFISKISDALGEEYETEVWLDYSKDCSYISIEKHDFLLEKYDEVRKILNSMIIHSGKWCGTKILNSKN
jgi:four helix bundle protein